MDTDPLASMRCWTISVRLGGREYDIPALPAVDWWPILAEPDPGKIVDFLPSTSTDEIDLALLDGTLTGKELSAALTDVIEEATGRSMHAAFVLTVVAAMHWQAISGRLVLAGIRFDQLSIAAVLDAIYILIVEHMKDEDRAKFDALLENEALTQPGRKRTTPSQRVVTEFEAMAGPRPAPAPLPGPASAALSGGARSRTRTRPRPPRQPGRSAAPTTRP